MDDDIEEPSLKRRRKGKEIAHVAKTISFNLTPAGFLKDSLRSLTDSQFNPIRIGMVEINHRGFQITVRNEESNVFATIIYKCYQLTDFCCSEPLVPHMMFLDDIVEFLNNIHVNATINISYIDGAKQPKLCFKFHSANSSPKKVNAKLMKLKVKPQRFPDMLPLCKAPITMGVLKAMIKHLQKNSQLVSVKVKKKVVIVTIGVDEESDDWERWRIDCGEVSAENGMKHHAWFHLPHLRAMRKASVLDRDPVIYFLRQPENHILLHFRFVGFGEVLFLLKAHRLETAPDLEPPSGETPEASDSESDLSESSDSESDTSETSESASGKSETSHSEGDASETLQSGGDASETSESGNDKSETLQSGGDASETLQSGGDASETSESGNDKSETSQSGGDASDVSQSGADAPEASQSGGDADNAS